MVNPKIPGLQIFLSRMPEKKSGYRHWKFSLGIAITRRDRYRAKLSDQNVW